MQKAKFPSLSKYLTYKDSESSFTTVDGCVWLAPHFGSFTSGVGFAEPRRALGPIWTQNFIRFIIHTSSASARSMNSSSTWYNFNKIHLCL
jgi:hypothetical protein